MMLKKLKEDVYIYMLKAILNITQTTHDKLSENDVKDGENEIILSS